MSRDHIPKSVTEFRGLFDRGDDEVTPENHFSIARNIVYTHRGFETRFGIDRNIDLTNILRIRVYKRTGEVSRLIILRSGGLLYDSLNLVTPILTIAAMTDFDLTTFFNRAYITPSNGETGLSGESVYVYDGTTCRVAAGTPPSGTLVVANSASSGSIEAGTHLFAVAFETESGFITKPGPTLFAILSATGAKQADLSGIPTGPAGTVARIILATRFIETYDGNQFGYEFFFVPSGRISGNITTTATVDFFDANLLQSADYLFDQLETIPAGVGIGNYKSRLAVWGAQADPSIARFSKSGDPESHNAIEGFCLMDPGEPDGIAAGIEFRDSFYMTKSLRTSMVTDANGLEPAFWQPISIDPGIGSEPNGIGAILNKRGTNIDAFLVASRSGLMFFNGVYAAIPLTFKVEAIWSRITDTAYNKIQVAVDSTKQMIYCLLPLDGSTTPTAILVGDYREGMSADTIRWAMWDFFTNPTSIVIDIVNSTQKPFLRISNALGVSDYDPGSYEDDDNAILTSVRFAPIKLDDSGIVGHYGAVRLLVSGVGELIPRFWGLQSVESEPIAAITLSSSPGVERERLGNLSSEQCAVQLDTLNFGEHFKCTKMTLFVKPIWASRAIE